MPFTFSHPAIVLPLAKLSKRYVSLTGLVAGSLAPDFEYFIRMIPHSEYSHTLVGIFTFNLPVGILISYLFHYLIRNELIDHLPAPLYLRFSKFKSFNWPEHAKTHFLAFLVSVIIGAFSHVFWDSFTHAAGFFVQVFPILNTKVAQFPFFRIIQHGSTLAGFLVIGWVVFNMEKQTSQPPVNSFFEYWVVVAVIAIFYVGGVFGVFFTLRKYFPYYGVFVVSSINGFMIGVMFASFLNKKSWLRRTRFTDK